ncbi:MAG: hypothetical protein ACLPQS_10510 [Acidimicrobiales bacterium]
MKRLITRLLALPVGAALVLLGSGCNVQWSPYAAKVGSTVITPAQLDSALHIASSNNLFECLLEHSSSGGYRFDGAGSDTYDSSFVAFVLTNLIDTQVAHTVVQSAHLALPPAAVALARSQVNGAFAGDLTSECGSTQPDLLGQLGPALSDSFVQLQLDEDALAARAAHVPLTLAGIASYEAAHPSVTEESCLSGLFVKTKATGKLAARLLKQGASMSSVLAKYSPGTAGNGSFGCYTNAQLASDSSTTVEAAVAAARTGATVGPVSYAGSNGTAYVVLRITSRPFEPALDGLDQIFTTYSQAFSSAVSAGVRRASIKVNPQYGTWTTKAGSSSSSASGFGGRVEVPAGSPMGFVLNPSAVQGPLLKAPVPSSGSGG